MSLSKGFKFVDLFSGIGGFHQAMTSFGGVCVLASDIDESAINVYKRNYGIDSAINVRDIDPDKLEDFDVLCAGFPCQTFSKAGKRLGFMDQTRGTLFFEVARILKAKHPKYIMLENVRNLVGHDNGHTYEVICKALNELGYRIPKTPLILSPHQFGIPQVRERVYIPGKYEPEKANEPLDFAFDGLKEKPDNSIYTVLEKDNDDPRFKISEHHIDLLNAWDEFYHGIDLKVIGFPVWFDYFCPGRISKDTPKWKADFIEKNRQLYLRNKDFIDSWSRKWDVKRSFNNTERKFEWQCGTAINTIWEGVIQLRPSGVRVKKPDCFQALVALVQTPIIGKFKRRLTVKEAGRLQSFPDDFIPDDNMGQAYKQFGNSVNVDVVRKVFEALLAF